MYLFINVFKFDFLNHPMDAHLVILNFGNDTVNIHLIIFIH